jgi:hypothetical protein
MSDWPVLNRYPYCSNLQAEETEYVKRVDFTVLNTKGAWTELVASAPFDIGMFIMNVTATWTYGDFLFDIAIGASGSEIVLVSNLSYCQAGSSWWSNSAQYIIPIMIPAGTRISARVQGTVLAAGPLNWLKMSTQLFPANQFLSQQFSQSETLGALTASSNGTEVDPGTSANTKGAWTELVAATTIPIKAFHFSLSSGADLFKTSCYWAVDIGVGAESSEIAIVSDYCIALWASSYQMHPQTSPLLPIEIPLGSRVSARCKCTITTAGDRYMHVSVVGFG